jgi:hypothetical protein
MRTCNPLEFARRVAPAAMVAVLALPSTTIAGTLQVRAGENLQAVLNAAQPGDVILLEAGATFTGNFVLPLKTGSAFITIRSSAPDAALPGAGQRIGPEWADALPKVRSGNSASALRTAAGAHHWRLQFLEFQSNKDGYGDIIALGDGSAAQGTLAEVPHDLELDRVYVHGDPLAGQKRGISLNAGAVTIRNSYISDCKAVGQDAQAIAGWNGPGPFLIENNYLEGAGENVLFGGADPSIAGLAPSDVVFRRNHLAKPLAWRDPIIQSVTGLIATPADGGTLSAGRLVYLVVAQRGVGQGTVGRSTAAAIDVDVPANGSVQLRWSPVLNATQYQVFGRGYSWTVTTPTFTDTGAAGTVASAPGSSGTYWLVKNIFELKNARRFTIEHNVFEYNWPNGQVGYAIVFTPRNSNHTCDWCAIDDVAFQYNIVRHTAAAVNIAGHDSPEVSGLASNIRIRHNLFNDVSSANWGGNGWFLLMGDGPRDIKVDHNTIDHDGGSLVYVSGGTSASPAQVLGFQFSNNLARHQNYGINGAWFSFGNAIIAAFFPDGIVDHDLFSGGPASRYPSGNYFNTDFASVFISLSAGDYRLNPAGMAKRAASDGTDLGADMAALLAGVAGVTEGSGSVQQTESPAPRPPANLRVIR